MSARRARSASRADEIHTAVATALADAEVRYTTTRRTVIDVLAATGRPLTVADVCERAAAPQSSVYRILATFEELGLVHRLTNDASEFARFELAEDLLGHHHHLACARCGAMTDVILPPGLEAELDRALSRLARVQRFTVDAHRLDVIGTCATCAKPPLP